MKIQILGGNCRKSDLLMKNTQIAVDELEKDFKVEKVDDIVEILRFGISVTPAIALNGKVVSSGKVLSPDAIKKYIKYRCK